jgi:tripartite-type tricarboxylate transporter receptor subunit TctC
MIRKSKRGKGSLSRSLVLALLLSLLFIPNFLKVPEAAEYPTKSIQMMVGYPPGGGSDLLARILVDPLSSLLRQQVVVVNKPGGGGVVCAYNTLNAPADGYTIMVIPPAMFLAPYLVKGVTYDIIRDFKQISLATNSPLLLCVGKDSPWQTFEQLVADAKKNPGKLTYAAAGYGNTWLQGELIKLHGGINITYVPMPGMGDIIPAVMGGHISLCYSDLAPIAEHLRAGTLRALMIMDTARHKSFPNIPTSAEKGFPKVSSFQTVAVKAGTPQPIVQKLEKAFKEALSDKEIADKIERMGQVVKNGDSQEASKFLIEIKERFLEVAKILNIVPR